MQGAARRPQRSPAAGSPRSVSWGSGWDGVRGLPLTAPCRTVAPQRPHPRSPVRPGSTALPGNRWPRRKGSRDRRCRRCRSRRRRCLRTPRNLDHVRVRTRRRSSRGGSRCPRSWCRPRRWRSDRARTALRPDRRSSRRMRRSRTRDTLRSEPRMPPRARPRTDSRRCALHSCTPGSSLRRRPLDRRGRCPLRRTRHCSKRRNRTAWRRRMRYPSGLHQRRSREPLSQSGDSRGCTPRRGRRTGSLEGRSWAAASRVLRGHVACLLRGARREVPACACGRIRKVFARRRIVDVQLEWAAYAVRAKHCYVGRRTRAQRHTFDRSARVALLEREPTPTVARCGHCEATAYVKGAVLAARRG